MKEYKEGDLYKILHINGKTFEIRYGYNSEEERQRWSPTPIFPDFEKEPLFTEEGKPFVTAIQNVCEYYKPKEKVSGEEWCNDCTKFSLNNEMIGICEETNNLK